MAERQKPYRRSESAQNRNSGEPVLLGEVETPTGILLILDPGLGEFWRGDGDPRSPRESDPHHVDLRIVGDDASTAGKAYDRQFDPRYLYDIPDLVEAQRRFDEFVSQKRLKAHLEPLPKSIPHTERAAKALESGNGLGIVQYNGMWAVVVGGLPTNRVFPIYGLPMLDDEFRGRWRTIEIVIDPVAKAAHSDSVEGVMVEYGEFICADLKAFNEFRAGESLDGLGDFVFWGADAEPLAKEVTAPRLDDETYGWVNLPLAEVQKKADLVQGIVEKRGLKAGFDYRPHCNLERLNSQVRSTEKRAGNLVLSGSKICGFDNRWGDGVFPVIRDFDTQGKLARIRIDVGNEDRCNLMRRIFLRYKMAIVAKKVLNGDEPLRFAVREKVQLSQDSGWTLSAGTETGKYMKGDQNLAPILIKDAMERWPMLKNIIDTPPPASFKLEGGKFVPEK